uniref:Uncharacterized protein n=1 Tax=Pyxicephalus adspersus TaxID=30357 RepID=A0AAV3AJ77_PYXAD|nr:TPA: hypothetical protein GDO54_011323 [Pyxicephalus adspersus]
MAQPFTKSLPSNAKEQESGKRAKGLGYVHVSQMILIDRGLISDKNLAHVQRLSVRPCWQIHRRGTIVMKVKRREPRCVVLPSPLHTAEQFCMYNSRSCILQSFVFRKNPLSNNNYYKCGRSLSVH